MRFVQASSEKTLSQEGMLVLKDVDSENLIYQNRHKKAGVETPARKF